MKKVVLIIMIIAIALILIASGLYFFNGSLEMFPTAEKESGVRLVMGIIAVGCVFIEAILVALLKRRSQEDEHRLSGEKR